MPYYKIIKENRSILIPAGDLDMPLPIFYKTANEVLNYTFDWSNWLVLGDQILTTTFTVQSGLTNVSHANDTTFASIILSGGTTGTNYSVNCKIVTVNSLTAERNIQVNIISVK